MAAKGSNASRVAEISNSRSAPRGFGSNNTKNTPYGLARPVRVVTGLKCSDNKLYVYTREDYIAEDGTVAQIGAERQELVGEIKQEAANITENVIKNNNTQNGESVKGVSIYQGEKKNIYVSGGDGIFFLDGDEIKAGDNVTVTKNSDLREVAIKSRGVSAGNSNVSVVVDGNNFKISTVDTGYTSISLNAGSGITISEPTIVGRSISFTISAHYV